MNIRIGNKFIGDESPVFIVAELSANHMKNFDIAAKTIKAIKESGADAVKFQTYTPDTITIDSDNEYFKIKGTPWNGRTLYQLYKEAYMPWEWQPKLKKISEELGLICFSSPFDRTSVDFLEKINIPAYKIASFEITDIPLIEYVASKGKPLIISTGIATISDIEEAVNACKRMHNDRIILLKCTSIYPTSIDDVNLRTIPNIVDTFRTIVGISDHTLTTSIPIAAVALGAKVVEKHFILDRKIGGTDSKFSIEPLEFKYMVDSIREVEKALGNVNYSNTNGREFSRSIFVVQDIKVGEFFTKENIKSIRPFYGIPPKYLMKIIGMKSRSNIKKGTPLSWKMVE